MAAIPGFAEDSIVAARVGRLGSVDATPRACAPGLHLVEQAVHVFTAQASAGGTSTTHSCRFGSVDATPGASALEIDLARAHNSGCTFFVSENDVLLTEDVIPPPCIVHATRTDNGAVYELRKFRSAYKRVCAASSLHLPADMCHNSLTTIAAISAQHMMPLFGRFTSRSRRELSSPTGLKTSRQRWAVSPWTPLGPLI